VVSITGRSSISHEVSSEVKSYVLNDGDVMIRRPIMAYSDVRRSKQTQFNYYNRPRLLIFYDTLIELFDRSSTILGPKSTGLNLSYYASTIGSLEIFRFTSLENV